MSILVHSVKCNPAKYRVCVQPLRSELPILATSDTHVVLIPQSLFSATKGSSAVCGVVTFVRFWLCVRFR